MYDDLIYKTDDGIATVTIDRPEVYNAFTAKTITELNDALGRAERDDGVHVIILNGSGDGFCAGADVTSMPDWSEQTLEEYAGYLWAVQNIVRRLRAMAKPSIAAVGGPAIGAGCDFALACDFRVAGVNALFRQGFVRVGLVPGDGGAWLLPRLIGEAKAKEYLLTGKDMSAEDAEELGLVVGVTDDSHAAARDLAADVLELPALAVRNTNRLVDPQQDFETYCKQAISYQWECVNDNEHREAVLAFNESRAPEYDREYN